MTSTSTILRTINLPTFKQEGEIVRGQSRRDKKILFHCDIHSQFQSLFQEEIEGNRTMSIRVKNLTSPPPIFDLSSYSSVTKLELSCPVQVRWVFSIASELPLLHIIRFGGSCFLVDSPFGDPEPLTVFSKREMSKSPQVNELVMTYNYAGGKLNTEDNVKLVSVMDCILEHAAHFLSGLNKSNLTLPIGTDIDGFLARFPTMRANGDKREVFSKGYVQFVSNSSSSSSSGRKDSTGSTGSSGSGRAAMVAAPIHPPLKKSKYSAPAHEYMFFSSEDEPCSSTTRSPRSDRSSADSVYSRRTSTSSNSSGYNTGGPPKSPSMYTIQTFEDMYTRRRYN